jgi:hypothetical protein
MTNAFGGAVFCSHFNVNEKDGVVMVTFFTPEVSEVGGIVKSRTAVTVALSLATISSLIEELNSKSASSVG